MADRANVLSVEGIRDARTALVRFAEEAEQALQDADFDIRRTQDWLNNHQRLHWQGEIRRWDQRLAQAKADLHRKKLARFLDRQPDTAEEEKAVRYAQGRLEEAHKKFELIRKIQPELQHAIQEYRGQAQPLASMIEVEIPRGLARLDAMLDALEAYLNLKAPSTGFLAEHEGVEGIATARRAGEKVDEQLAASEPAAPEAGPGEPRAISEEPDGER